MLGNLIGGFITILVGTVLMPTVADAIYVATGSGNLSNTNLTTTSVTLLNLTTIFYALAIAAAGIAVGTQALREAGLLGM
jgi:hypothetical protein